MSNQKTARSNRYTDYKDFCEQVQRVLSDKEGQHRVDITINWKNDDNSYTGSSSTYLFYDNPIPDAKRKIDYLQSELEKERVKLAKFEEERVRLAKFEEERDEVKTQPKNKKAK